MIRHKIRFNSVAIYCHHKPAKEKIEIEFLNELLDFFKKKGVKKVSGDIRVVSMLKNKVPLINDDQRYDLKIGIGGDGTLLKMIRTLQKKDGLLLGINFGTLGFLSELMPERALKNIEKIFNGEFKIDERMLVKSFVWRKNNHEEKEKVFRAYGLNEIVFGHGGLARLTNFDVKVDRRILAMYRSDGLIFATPTGSTAYSLSASGPIIYPSIKTILVTPIAPHTLTHRPILLPPNKIIHLKFDSRVNSIAMTIDGQIHFSCKPTDEVTVQKATRTVKFIRLKKSHYFKTLRSKFAWGV